MQPYCVQCASKVGTNPGKIFARTVKMENENILPRHRLKIKNKK
jgi:hypothetical protein